MNECVYTHAGHQNCIGCAYDGVGMGTDLSEEFLLQLHSAATLLAVFKVVTQAYDSTPGSQVYDSPPGSHAMLKCGMTDDLSGQLTTAVPIKVLTLAMVLPKPAY